MRALILINHKGFAPPANTSPKATAIATERAVTNASIARALLSCSLRVMYREWHL